MTGPEHYAEAERMALQAEHAFSLDQPARAALLMQKAQVHATLALAAATAEAQYDRGIFNSPYVGTS